MLSAEISLKNHQLPYEIINQYRGGLDVIAALRKIPSGPWLGYRFDKLDFTESIQKHLHKQNKLIALKKQSHFSAHA